jgi:hypothetical protein
MIATFGKALCLAGNAANATPQRIRCCVPFLFDALITIEHARNVLVAGMVTNGVINTKRQDETFQPAIIWKPRDRHFLSFPDLGYTLHIFGNHRRNCWVIAQQFECDWAVQEGAMCDVHTRMVNAIR